MWPGFKADMAVEFDEILDIVLGSAVYWRVLGLEVVAGVGAGWADEADSVSSVVCCAPTSDPVDAPVRQTPVDVVPRPDSELDSAPAISLSGTTATSADGDAAPPAVVAPDAASSAEVLSIVGPAPCTRAWSGTGPAGPAAPLSSVPAGAASASSVVLLPGPLVPSSGPLVRPLVLPSGPVTPSSGPVVLPSEPLALPSVPVALPLVLLPGPLVPFSGPLVRPLVLPSEPLALPSVPVALPLVLLPGPVMLPSGPAVRPPGPVADSVWAAPLTKGRLSSVLSPAYSRNTEPSNGEYCPLWSVSHCPLWSGGPVRRAARRPSASRPTRRLCRPAGAAMKGGGHSSEAGRPSVTLAAVSAGTSAVSGMVISGGMVPDDSAGPYGPSVLGCRPAAQSSSPAAAAARHRGTQRSVRSLPVGATEVGVKESRVGEGWVDGDAEPSVVDGYGTSVGVWVWTEICGWSVVVDGDASVGLYEDGVVGSSLAAVGAAPAGPAEDAVQVWRVPLGVVQLAEAGAAVVVAKSRKEPFATSSRRAVQLITMP
ncbi:hypothetical protein FJT64_010356 [Amphibalanus amphitrite]|uniref:Uncharacterized protein n=1 Tax=Amphibalanus amphitrite TaxID=1232801 RepID=A0A6A4VJR7_AMPAM|nr:hypothetical protein FJT64_010356 [Amphibalanus amphitrite]